MNNRNTLKAIIVGTAIETDKHEKEIQRQNNAITALGSNL